jgi:hypothetical protein
MKISSLVCVAVVLLCLARLASCDVYLHSPRGSNNRLNEQSATRNNNNRLFDSQNNNRGGYNVGVTTADSNGGNEAQHSKMQVFGESIFPVEWTNQHGSGKDNLNVHSNFVLQYMCGNSLRNGQNTNEGNHESDAYYEECKQRPRNKGLFTADEDLNGETAIYTRQNPNGGRSGNECPEERDYFPYWVENPWKDIAYLTSEEERCVWLDEVDPNEERYCGPSAYSRDNHLGNTYGGYPIMYNWSVPTPQEACGAASCQCVLRLRYNISTADSVWIEEDGEQKLLDYWLLNATYNDEFSPLKNDPYVDIDVDQVFKLAINTAQTARTFQDRSHIFRIVERPADAKSGEIYNVIVRGKRGNIVQTYPAVEYDFTPNHLHIDQKDWVHFQWEGSNTHDNNPAVGFLSVFFFSFFFFFFFFFCLSVCFSLLSLCFFLSSVSLFFSLFCLSVFSLFLSFLPSSLLSFFCSSLLSFLPLLLLHCSLLFLSPLSPEYVSSSFAIFSLFSFFSLLLLPLLRVVMARLAMMVKAPVVRTVTTLYR